MRAGADARSGACDNAPTPEFGRGEKFQQAQQHIALRRALVRQRHQRLAGNGKLEQPVDQQQIGRDDAGRMPEMLEQHQAKEAKGKHLLQAFDQQNCAAQPEQGPRPVDQEAFVPTADSPLGAMDPDRHGAE